VQVLADEATRMLHGAQVLESIHQTAAALFAGKGGSLDDLPKIELSPQEAAEGVGILDVFVATSLPLLLLPRALLLAACPRSHRSLPYLTAHKSVYVCVCTCAYVVRL